MRAAKHKNVAAPRPQKIVPGSIDLEQALASWANLNKVVARMTAAQALAAIELEQAGRNRQTYVTRLKQRYAAVAQQEARSRVG